MRGVKKVKDFIVIDDLSNQQIEHIFHIADDMAGIIESGTPLLCRGKIMATLFYEPSTRTRFSFQSAMMRLGGSVLGFDNPDNTSVVKGETIADTARIMSDYADIIVLRHPLAGAPKLMADYASVPVINGGDNSHQHPTQTLYDLYTIRKHMGPIGELNVGLCGDLKYGRTVHSLVYALARLGANIVCISPEALQMPDNVKKRLKLKYKREIETATRLEDVIPELDVLYMTRIQKERLPENIDYNSVSGKYVIDKSLLDLAKREMIILHPLPRVDEIAYDVDTDDRAFYFRQSGYGVRVRMAITALLLGALKIPDSVKSEPPPRTVMVNKKCPNPQCVLNHEKYLKPEFEVVSELMLGCIYCGYEPVDIDQTSK
ncbi:aspartate carbamoyltransferase [Candidatus Poribacteria bacterium]|nr:aspartate carbamoyltransferase [Candidatus Poribacteria bacterium]